MTPDRQIQHSQARHRRETWFQIYLWLGIGLAVLLFCAIVGLLLSRGQLALVANFVVTVLVLCPAVICLLPVYLLLAVAVFGIFGAHDKVARPLNRLQGLSFTLRESAEKALDRIAYRFIHLDSGLAALDKWLLNKFDRPPASGDNGDRGEHE